MASENSYSWIESHKKYIRGRVLEIGSRRYKDHSFLDLRNLSERQDRTTVFFGTDLLDGENVDIVTDLTMPLDSIIREFDNKKFHTIFCISVLEHIPDIFTASRNISDLLEPGGAIFISVPFVFRFHGYPNDYWRLTPEAVKFLFSDVDFRDNKYSQVSTLESGDTMPLSKDRLRKMNRFLYRPKSREEKIERKRAKIESESQGVEPYTLAPSMINMLGFKKLS